MVRCNNVQLHRGPWSPEEDAVLANYIQKHGKEKNWSKLPKAAGLQRCGKSCRLRWLNYLRPDIKRGNFSQDEIDLIIRLHALLGNRWSIIAGRIPGRSDNEIKNYWNYHISKKLLSTGVDPKTHKSLENVTHSSKLYSLNDKMRSPDSNSSSSRINSDSEEDSYAISDSGGPELQGQLSSLDFLESFQLNSSDLLEVLDSL